MMPAFVLQGILAVRLARPTDHKNGTRILTMPNEKDIAFINFLLESTQQGTLKWEPTAMDGEYAAGLKGKYTVTVERDRDDERDIFYKMTLRNAEDGREILTITAYRGDLQTLYERAQRLALNVDSVIDEIMG